MTSSVFITNVGPLLYTDYGAAACHGTQHGWRRGVRFRYQLMDVDVIFQQGYVYPLATLVVLAVFYGLLVSITAGRTIGPEGSEHSLRFDDLSPAALVVLILVAAFVFQPIRNQLQEVLDRQVFYRVCYDYRRTLIEFARELGAETDLNRMLSSVSDRLLRTLSI